MTGFLDKVEKVLVGRKANVGPILMSKQLDSIGPDALTYSDVYELCLSFHTRVSISNDVSLEKREQNMKRLIDMFKGLLFHEVYGEFRGDLLELSSAVYSADSGKSREILDKILDKLNY